MTSFFTSRLAGLPSHCRLQFPPVAPESIVPSVASSYDLSVVSFSFLLSPIHSLVRPLTQSLTFSLSSTLSVVQLWTATLIPFSFAGQVEPILVSLVAINQPSVPARQRPPRSTGILSSVRPADSWPDRSLALVHGLAINPAGVAPFLVAVAGSRPSAAVLFASGSSVGLRAVPGARFFSINYRRVGSYTFGTRKSPRVIDTSGWRERDVSVAVASDAACVPSLPPRVYSCYASSASSCSFPPLLPLLFFLFSCARIRVSDSFAQSRGEKWKFQR